MKEYTFKEFKEFISQKCGVLKIYKQGGYDRKIYNWFDIGKPKKIEFFDGKGGFKKYKK